MPVSVNVQTVYPRKLAAVRREVPPGAVGATWGPALGKVWPFIRSHRSTPTPQSTSSSSPGARLSASRAPEW
jgi:hypothetical protein